MGLAILIRFTILGPAVAKGRARSTGKATRPFTPEETRRYERIVQAAAIVAMGNRTPLRGPVSMTVVEHRGIPASWPAAKRAQALAGEVLPTGKPDLTNVLKSIEDAVNEICYQDDAQIVSLRVEKRYAAEPSVDIEIAPWP